MKHNDNNHFLMKSNSTCKNVVIHHFICILFTSSISFILFFIYNKCPTCVNQSQLPGSYLLMKNKSISISNFFDVGLTLFNDSFVDNNFTITTTDTLRHKVKSKTQVQTKLNTRVLMYIPTPIEWTQRRRTRTQSFIDGNWSSKLIHLIYVIGYKTGTFLESDIDYSAVVMEAKDYTNHKNIHYMFTACRNFGEEYNNPNGTASTGCKGYQFIKYAVLNYNFEYIWRGSEDAYINFKFFFSNVVPNIQHKKNVFLGQVRLPYLEPNPWDLYLSSQPDLQRNVWRIREFGAYMAGMGFMISKGVADFIANWSIEPHQTYCEDVVFAQWLMPFQIEWIHAPNHMWSVYNRHDYDVSRCYSQLLVHYVHDEDWSNIDSDGNMNFCK